jgi:hypothetical protein
MSHTNSLFTGLDNTKFNGIEKQYSMIFNSSISNYTSPSGSKFTISLDSPISIPSNARSCEICLANSNVWNSSPNIIRGKNDKFYYTVNGAPFDITIPQGLYSLNDINVIIGDLIFNIHGTPKDAFVFYGNTANQTVNITFTYAKYAIDFTPIETFRDILGYNAEIVPNPTTFPTGSTAGYTVFGDKVAGFNTINAFLITSDLVLNGLPIGNRSESIIGSVPIIAPPNSLIAWEAKQFIWIQCDHLIGKYVYVVNFRLTNEKLEDIIVIEPYNFTIIIRYTY